MMEKLLVKKTGAALGAFVENIDLTVPLDEEVFSSLHDALCENEVLFFISRRGRRGYMYVVKYQLKSLIS